MRLYLIAAGVALIIMGLLWPWIGRIGWGHLPGDLSVRRTGFAFYFPLGSGILISILLSLVLSLLMWLFRR